MLLGTGTPLATSLSLVVGKGRFFGGGCVFCLAQLPGMDGYTAQSFQGLSLWHLDYGMVSGRASAHLCSCFFWTQRINQLSVVMLLCMHNCISIILARFLLLLSKHRYVLLNKLQATLVLAFLLVCPAYHAGHLLRAGKIQQISGISILPPCKMLEIRASSGHSKLLWELDGEAFGPASVVQVQLEAGAVRVCS